METLLRWVNFEAEIKATAMETIEGLDCESAPCTVDKPVKATAVRARTHVAKQAVDKSRVECGESHSIEKCAAFQKRTVKDRWKIAQDKQLCYRCLSAHHRGKDCKWSRRCGVDGCWRHHHRLLHGWWPEPPSTATTETGPTVKQQPVSGEVEDVRDAMALSHLAANCREPSQVEAVALRTVPVLLSANGTTAKVNAVLDDGSTKTYINADLAAHLELRGEPKPMSVAVLNGDVMTFHSTPVEFTLTSVSGDVTVSNMQAEALNQVAGDFRPVNWKRRQRNWTHLSHISFPSLGPRLVVDLLIRLVHNDLHRSIQDIAGEPGEPVARLTPLGGRV